MKALIVLSLMSICFSMCCAHAGIESDRFDHAESQLANGECRTQRGKASFYGDRFAGRKTANGEIFNPSHLTAAHKTAKFNSIVFVTNLNNSQTIMVRINDRGPFIKGRIIDLSESAAEEIGMIQSGHAPVEIQICPPA